MYGVLLKQCSRGVLVWPTRYIELFVLSILLDTDKYLISIWLSDNSDCGGQCYYMSSAFVRTCYISLQLSVYTPILPWTMCMMIINCLYVAQPRSECSHRMKHHLLFTLFILWKQFPVLATWNFHIHFTSKRSSGPIPRPFIARCATESIISLQ